MAVLSADVFRNPAAGPVPGAGPEWRSRAPLEFHRRLPRYRPTPVLDTPGLASAAGVGRVLVKDESSRLGLPAFKMLGASWATYRVLVERLAADPEPWSTVDELADRLAPLRPLRLVAATDGNHGRAVARMARLLGLDAGIFVPEGTAPARIDGIEAEGATVTVVDGTYEDAVERSKAEAGERALVISDTSWPDYETVPAWVIEGYSTIFHEIDDQLGAEASTSIDAVVVPIGVGALAAAVVRHYRSGAGRGPAIIGVEPTTAAAALASARAGRMVPVPGPHRSIMAGLNCGEASLIAWPLMQAGIDWFVSIEDEWAEHGMRELAAAGVVAGETGAAAAGALQAVVGAGYGAELGLTREATVLVLCTEGATDPANYAAIVGHPPPLRS